MKTCFLIISISQSFFVKKPIDGTQMHYHIINDSYFASKQGNIAFNQQKTIFLK
jgi:hypothetical protein